MPRLAFAITELDPGGAERALAQIASGLLGKGWEIRTYCLGPETPLAAEMRAAGVTVECFGMRHSRDLGGMWSLRQRLKQFRPQILQAFLFHANLAARLTAWGIVPHVLAGVRVSEHDRPGRLRWDRWTRRLIHRYVCVSQGVADFTISQGIPASQVCVIPNGVDGQRFAAATPLDLTVFGLPAGASVLLGIGRLTPQKGFDLLLHAAAPLLQQRPEWHLLIAGEGPDRAALEALVGQLGLDQQVHLPGRVENIPGLLRACDLFVLPSRWEGMPNVVLEAVAAGRRVVAADVEGISDLATAGVRLSVCNPNDEESLRFAIEQNLNRVTSDDAEELDSQRVVLEEFSWPSVVERYDELFRGLLDGANR